MAFRGMRTTKQSGQACVTMHRAANGFALLLGCWYMIPLPPLLSRTLQRQQGLHRGCQHREMEPMCWLSGQCQTLQERKTCACYEKPAAACMSMLQDVYLCAVSTATGLVSGKASRLQSHQLQFSKVDQGILPGGTVVGLPSAASASLGCWHP